MALPVRFLAPHERYFQRYYFIDDAKRGDMYIHQHTNTLCVIGLAPTHAAIGRKPVAVEYREGRNAKVTGKRKRGGMYVQEHTPLCDVLCEDGSRWPVLARVKGHLVEVNERLLTEPALLASSPESEGYIAIVTPKFAERKSAVAGGVGRAEFCARRGVAEEERVAPAWCVMDEEAAGGGEAEGAEAGPDAADGGE